MTSINNTSLASYFSLNNSDNSAAQPEENSTPGLREALAALSGNSSQSNRGGGGNSYLLDLSEEARSYLQAANGSTTSTSTTSSANEIVLSREQQNSLNAILLKYKDAPYDDETFIQIQKDMDAVGLNAATLAAQSQVRQLNPTLMLLNALNGIESSAGTMGDIDSTAMNFLKKVADQWKDISTTAE